MRKLSPARCSVLIFFFFYLAVAHAQNTVPTHPVDGTFIKEWLVLGPFFSDDLKTDLLASVNGEALANPKPGDTVTTAEGEMLTWAVYRTEGNIIDLQRVIGRHQEAVCYAFCLLESDHGGDGEFLVGSDDGVAVFFNGQRIHTQQVRRTIVVDENKVPVSLRPGKNRCLVKVSNGFRKWEFAARVLPPTRAVVAGVITDETKNTLSNVPMHLWQGSTLIAKTETDTKGSYQFSVYPASGQYDIQATHGDKGKWETGVQLSAGDRTKINLTLQQAISISGTLLKYDNTPHVGVLVEAVLLGKNSASQRRVTTLSDNRGQYKFINLRAGRYQIRCHTLKTQEEDPNKIVSVDRPDALKNVDFRFAPFKHGTWKHYTYFDGLANNPVRPIYQDREGFLWFGTHNGGVSRYDGENFVNLTTDDGLAHNSVWTIFQDREGFLYFGTGSGISQYDGKTFINFTDDHEFINDTVLSIYQDREDFLWFGTMNNGVFQYDGEVFVNFTTDDGFINDSVLSIYQDKDGFLWFGTLEGITRYDGNRFVNFTRDERLSQYGVFSIHQDQDGYHWFGTHGGGVFRYDGNAFVNFTTTDGLASNSVWVIHQDRDGFFWFGTDVGVSHYDGEKFVNFTTKDGLAQNEVSSIYQDRDGSIWFGTRGGVSQYDGTSWTSLDTRDGLINNEVNEIIQDSDGTLWFGTLEGVTQYNPNRVPPRARIVSVQNHKISTQMGSPETIKDIATDTLVTIKYSSIDFKTAKGKRQYQVRIKEIDADWHKPTRSDTFSVSFEKPGTYTFEVVAIDRDLNYSAPTSLTLTIVLPWFQNGWILYPSGGAIVVLVLFCGVLAYRYYHQRQQVLVYQQEAVAELADAQEMQTGLIPQNAPEVPGFDISGVCISARTVSGDFFDYIPLNNGELAIVLADVTGKGMKGAMNAALSSGALHSVVKLEMSPSEMLWALNQNLYPRFQRFTNCAMAILTIDPKNKTFKYANAGIPYPIIKRSESDVEEISIDGLPLGAFQASDYEETQPIELKSGNIIILFSDGITEASQKDNPDQLYMETDRLTGLIKELDKTTNAETIIDAIIDDVRHFSGDAQQNDDMTIVVIKVL